MAYNDYIALLKSKNVTFSMIDEYNALEIMKTKFSYYTLQQYFPLFDSYHKGDNQGKFISLDFLQLLNIAEIDFRLRQIFMSVCLEIEMSLKTRLIFDAEKIMDADCFFSEYYKKDQDYLNLHYAPEFGDYFSSASEPSSIKKMGFKGFVDAAQFGTLERFIHAFYQQFASEIYGSAFAPFEKRLSCVRRIRNAVAHNYSLIGHLSVPSEKPDYEMMSLLGRSNIGNRSLKKNMSRAVVVDLCGTLYEYSLLCNDNRALINSLKQFDVDYCRKHSYLYSKVDTLLSVYRFFCIASDILLSNTPRTVTKMRCPNAVDYFT